MNILNIVFLIFINISESYARPPVECENVQRYNSSYPIQSDALKSDIDQTASHLINSPDHFTRKKGIIQEGAIYDSKGMLVCILPNDPKAYLYKADSEIEKLRNDPDQLSERLIAKNELCEKIKKKSSSLNLSNGDLLNRLHWSISEGNCNPIINVKYNGGELKVPEYTTPIYYQGFVLNNLRKKFSSENGMLRGACNAGPGKDFYPIYFERGGGHSKESFDLVLQPYTWALASAKEAFEKDDLKMKIGHCMKDLLPSVTLPLPSDPSFGKSQWAHDKRGCNRNHLTVKFQIGAKNPWAAETHCCFTGE